MSEIYPGSGENRPNPSNVQNSPWSPPIDKLKFTDVPAGATYLNVDGRHLTGPLQGFGQLWQKTFRLRLDGCTATPREVVQTWKENFPKFHARENRFITSRAGITPGEVVLINAMTPGGPISTGMLVLYVDDESFTLMTPEGHPESGWVTFTAYQEEGATVAQVQTLARANDPVYEMAFLFLGSKLQDSIWQNVLASISTYYGVDGEVQVQKTLVDPKRQWSRVKNVWHNAQIRTLLYTVGAPVRWIGSKLKQ